LFTFCIMNRSLFFTILLFLLNFQARSQDWVRIFGNNMIADVSWVIETYDKGYLILDNSHNYIWLIKTDINGYKLWEKKIGTGTTAIRFGNIELTPDNGYILGGAIEKYAIGSYDPAIIKLTPCGDLEWCSVVHTGGIYDFGTRAKPTPEGDYLLVALGNQSNPADRVQLFKFGQACNLYWKQTYNPDSVIWLPTPHDVRVDPDGYLISAMCYYPDSVNPTGGYERPYFIKTDTAGNILWWNVYGSVNGFHGFAWDATIKSASGNYYCLTQHSNTCDNPALVKILGTGQESYYHDFVPGLCPGGSASINWTNDSNIVTTAYGTLNGNTIHRWIKMDTLGVLQSFRDFPDYIDGTTHTTRTADNKFVSVARVNGIWLYLYKLNASLEYDSIYTYPMVYDSLCPGGVVSDTINPDCGLIVGLNELQEEHGTTKLRVFPNPASGRLTVELPAQLKMTDRQPGITSTSVIYQWAETTLEAYDPNGRRILSKVIPATTRKMEVDVSGWETGLCFFRLVYKKQQVAGVKVLIRR